eukprot:867241-Pyramimonas_sp.AAC.1
MLFVRSACPPTSEKLEFRVGHRRQAQLRGEETDHLLYRNSFLVAWWRMPVSEQRWGSRSPMHSFSHIDSGIRSAVVLSTCNRSAGL